LRGLNVVQQALDLGLPVTGSTVHYVIPAVDAGPVISRSEIRIEADDTEETLHEKLKGEEHRLIVAAVRAYAEKQRLINA
jgi:phosphoribosylglycinamide formyltransferase-1